MRTPTLHIAQRIDRWNSGRKETEDHVYKQVTFRRFRLGTAYTLFQLHSICDSTSMSHHACCLWSNPYDGPSLGLSVAKNIVRVLYDFSTYG